MIRPTGRAALILSVYNEQVIIHGKFGAQLRCANILNVSRQYVEQLVKAHPHKLVAVPEKVRYVICKVCECEVPSSLTYKRTCRDCKEQKLRHCGICNTVYRPDWDEINVQRHLCKKCLGNIHCTWQKENREKLNKYQAKRRREKKKCRLGDLPGA